MRTPTVLAILALLAATGVTPIKAAPIVSTPTIMTLASSPTQPNTIYVTAELDRSTDDCRYCARDWFARSDNGGATWTTTVATTGDGSSTGSIVASPNGRYLLRAVTFSLSPDNSCIDTLISTNGGRTWDSLNNRIGGFFACQDGLGVGVMVDPAAPNRLYATWARTFFGVDISDDDGATWTSHPDSISFGLIADPVHSATLYTMVAVTGGTMEWRRSDDGGAHWQPYKPPAADKVTGFYPLVDGTGTRLVGRTADPQYPINPDCVGSYGRTTRAYCPGVFAAVGTPRFWLSNAFGAGASYAVYDTGIYAVTPNSTRLQRLALSATLPFKLEDLHSLEAGPHAGDPIYAATAATIYVSRTLGHSWQVYSLTHITALPTDPEPAPRGTMRDAIYVATTHHLVRDPFLAFYHAYGGLSIFGLPLTGAFTDGGQLVQYFERARLVLAHGKAMISPLGRQLTATRHFSPVACCGSNGQQWFPATHHTLARPFLAYWRTHQGSLVFGPPLSEPFAEDNGDGSGQLYTVQYFQNGRLEYHPEYPGTPVMVGQLGRQALEARGWL